MKNMEIRISHRGTEKQRKEKRSADFTDLRGLREERRLVKILRAELRRIFMVSISVSKWEDDIKWARFQELLLF